MSRRYTILLVVLLLFSQPAFISAEETIFLEVPLDDVPVQDRGWILTITVIANADLNQTQLMVEESKGLKITAGEPLWEGALPAGGEHILEISLLLISPPPQTITIQAQGRTQEGIQFEKSVVRRIE